ncbi:hypothetical protein [Symbioplanes lichenis]|uniref:hypothetical protein n=1 Tax=Symbioplanes lichenis TaxID=1629072 RepID=UPI0027383FB7|nr:hypothetical protein [Actinoplanes lichenis]
MPKSDIRASLGLLDALWVLLATAAGGWAANFGVGLLCGVAMGAALGVWRLVQIQAQILQLRQAEFFSDDEA